MLFKMHIKCTILHKQLGNLHIHMHSEHCQEFERMLRKVYDGEKSSQGKLNTVRNRKVLSPDQKVFPLY